MPRTRGDRALDVDSRPELSAGAATGPPPLGAVLQREMLNLEGR